MRLTEFSVENSLENVGKTDVLSLKCTKDRAFLIISIASIIMTTFSDFIYLYQKYWYGPKSAKMPRYFETKIFFCSL